MTNTPVLKARDVIGARQRKESATGVILPLLYGSYQADGLGVRICHSV